MEPAIRVRSLNHFYGSGALRKQILFDISCDIYPGELVINTGPSGSGKTTMLTLVCGLRTLQEGSVRTLGVELKGASTRTMVNVRQNIGFIFQAHNLIGALTARQNVQMSLALDKSIAPSESRRRAEEMLAAVGLGKRIDHYPHQLSGGQRQRVAIARALVRGPKIVLADEPTAALDKASGREVVDLLQKLSKKQGCAILMVTHDNRILDVADRILTLEDGRISSFAAAIGTTAEHQLGAFTQMHRKGELRRHLSDLSDDEFSAALGAVTGEFEQALRAIDLANAEASSTLLNQMLDVAAARISAMLHAERTTVFVIDSTRQELRSKVAQTGDEHPLDIRVPIGVGIAGKVAGGAGAMNIADPQHHPDFNPEVDRRTGYHTRSILAMPITNRAGAIVGVAQVLNKKEQTAFTDTDATTLQRFIPSLGIILETCERLLTAAVTDHS